jgi:hypothetical protein
MSGPRAHARIQGGYEPVPTRDIHLNQIDLKLVWKTILQQYVRPVGTFHYMGMHARDTSI